MSTFRAAIYWAPDGTPTLMTAPEDAHLEDGQRLALAVQTAKAAGIIGHDPVSQMDEATFLSRLTIGDWEYPR